MTINLCYPTGDTQRRRDPEPHDRQRNYKLVYAHKTRAATCFFFLSAAAAGWLVEVVVLLSIVLSVCRMPRTVLLCHGDGFRRPEVRRLHRQHHTSQPTKQYALCVRAHTNCLMADGHALIAYVVCIISVRAGLCAFAFGGAINSRRLSGPAVEYLCEHHPFPFENATPSSNNNDTTTNNNNGSSNSI